MSVIPFGFRASYSGIQQQGHDPAEFASVLSAALLGAALYVPASRPDLAAIALGHKPSGARSLILCTEDAVHERDLEQALAHLAVLLPQLEHEPPLVFIRPRNPAVLRRLLRMEGIGRVRGFVLPKFDPHTLQDWLKVWEDRHGHYLMPILETAAAFDRCQMELLRDALDERGLRDHILCLRIGGNDLLNLLGIRRARGATIYDTPLRSIIADLACIFHPAGYRLSAPVFDRLDDCETLTREVECDLQHGLSGKAAIHPTQISVIEGCYRVSHEDFEMASAVLTPNAAAVFRLGDSFCEPVTHRRWAATVLERARVFGLRN